MSDRMVYINEGIGCKIKRIKLDCLVVINE